MSDDPKLTPEAAPPPLKPAAAAASTPRGTKILLGISLALNLAVAGMILGHALDGDGPGRMDGGPGSREFGFGPFTEALSRDDRMALREALIGRMPDLREARTGLHQDLTAVIAALEADPFDPEALTQAYKAQNRRMTDMLTLAQDLMLERLLSMDAAARLDLALRLKDRMPGGPGPDRDDD